MIKLKILRHNWQQNRGHRRFKRGVKRAKRLARQKHKMDNRRYYVLPGPLGSVVVFNRTQIQELNKQGYFGYVGSDGHEVRYGKMNFARIVKESIYIEG